MTDPKEVHRLDQLGAAVREVAHLVAVHYRALREEKIDADTAMELSARYQTGLIFTTLEEADEDEEI